MHPKVLQEFLASQNRPSWRRVTICMMLELFAAASFWTGRMDANTWVWFAGLLGSMYISNDTFEKVTKLYVAFRPTQPGSQERGDG